MKVCRFLWSARQGLAQHILRACRTILAGCLICLTVVVGCEVRPFSDLTGDENSEDNQNGNDQNDDGDNASEELRLTADPITTTPGTPGMTQVMVTNPNTSRTHTFSIATAPNPDNGTARVEADGTVTYTPEADFTGSDSLVVRVTDNGDPPLTNTISINITVR